MDGFAREDGSRMNEIAEQAAERYYHKYNEHMQVLESHSLLSKTRQITP